MPSHAASVPSIVATVPITCSHCAHQTQPLCLSHAKSYFIFPIKKGSVNAHMKLVGFSTSNKVKNQ